MSGFASSPFARTFRAASLAAAALSALAPLAPMAAAQELRTYRKAASFEDVKFDLENAITNRGLVIDFKGNVGGMLERTGKDVGSTKPIYAKAEYYSFCSARLSREMMEADPRNIAFCPFVLFVYETADKSGETVVGFRPMPKSVNASAAKAFAAIDALLDGIAKEAVK